MSADRPSHAPTSTPGSRGTMPLSKRRVPELGRLPAGFGAVMVKVEAMEQSTLAEHPDFASHRACGGQQQAIDEQVGPSLPMQNVIPRPDSTPGRLRHGAPEPGARANAVPTDWLERADEAIHSQRQFGVI